MRYSVSFSLDDEAFGYLKRVIVTPAVYPRLVEFLHFDIQSTGQKSHRVNTISSHHDAIVQLNSRIPPVRNSSKLVVNCKPDGASPVAETIHVQSRRSPPLPESSGSPQKDHTLQIKARHTQPLEPILFPKLRIYFADFPYLLCSMDQRLLTLET